MVVWNVLHDCIDMHTNLIFTHHRYLAVGTQLGIVAVWKFCGQARDVHTQVCRFLFDTGVCLRN